jgi:TetR/AcrR family transcriptional regulator, lmrAB and yxaGH operons repressor
MSTTRQQALDVIFGVFRDRGYDGASLADLSAATGLGRSSLYHHFPSGKDEMAEAAVDHARSWIEAKITAVAGGSGPPAKRLETILSALSELYDDGRNFCVLGQLAAASNRIPFRKKLGSSFEIWIAALAKLAMESGLSESDAYERAEEAVTRLQGAILLAAANDDRAPFRRAISAIRARLLAK